MPMFDEKMQKQLIDVLSKLKDDVYIIYFTQEFECGSCKETRDFLQEISGFSDKLKLEVFDFQKDKDKADQYDIDKIPAIALLDNSKNDTGIKFYGIPAGYEINSFIGSLVEVSGVKEPLPSASDISSRISAINKDVHIQVFVSLS